MQIQTGYNPRPNVSSAGLNKAPALAGQNQADENSGAESPEYKAISNKALMLLSDPRVSALERAKILNLLARGRAAAASGATGELNVLLNQMDSLNRGLTITGDSYQSQTAKPQAVSSGQDEDSVTYQDQSSDVGVSFSYPVAMNQYQAPLAVQAHEREHAIIAQAEALIHGENVTTYVAIHTGYDGRGRLIVTGGTTVVKTSPKPRIQPLRTGNLLDTIA